MRATILGWSAVSGLVLGLLTGVLVFGVIVIIGEMAPSILDRLGTRTRGIAAVVTLVVLPLIGAILGWLEGRLKLQ